MKRIGIIGGLGPEATIEYYKIINDEYRRRSPGDDYPKIIINSVNLTELLAMAEAGEWPRITDLLADAVSVLARAGADFALVSANTPHIVFDDLRSRVDIPMISIVEETARVAQQRGLRRLLLLGTKFTMRGTFYRQVFSRSGIELFVPEDAEQLYIHDKLIGEIGLGQIVDETRRELLAIIDRARERSGIDGVILGCTELPLILTEDAFGLPFLDTTRIHAESAVRRSLEDG
jgi:aspartate racemase